MLAPENLLVGQSLENRIRGGTQKKIRLYTRCILRTLHGTSVRTAKCHGNEIRRQTEIIGGPESSSTTYTERD